MLCAALHGRSGYILCVAKCKSVKHKAATAKPLTVAINGSAANAVVTVSLAACCCRSGCTAAVLLVLHRRSALQHCMADLDISCAGLSVALSVIATLSSSSHSRASHSSNKLWLCYKCCDKHHSLQCSSTASVILKCILQCWSC